MASGSKDKLDKMREKKASKAMPSKARNNLDKMRVTKAQDNLDKIKVIKTKKVTPSESKDNLDKIRVSKAKKAMPKQTLAEVKSAVKGISKQIENLQKITASNKQDDGIKDVLAGIAASMMKKDKLLLEILSTLNSHSAAVEYEHTVTYDPLSGDLIGVKSKPTLQ